MRNPAGIREPHIPIIALMRAADRARRELVGTLQPFDLTLQQFNVLIILRRADDKGLPTLDVAARLVEQTPGITRLMNTLITKRYIRRRQSRDDRRQQWCSLTDSGRRLIDSVIPRIRSTHERMLAGLRQDEITGMVESLDRVSNPNGGLKAGLLPSDQSGGGA